MAISQDLIDDLRDSLMDEDEHNELNLNEKELLDPKLETAITEGVKRFDLLPPPSNTNPDTLAVTDDIWYYIKRMSMIEAITMLVIKDIRNENRVNDQGGYQADEYGKHTNWLRLKEFLINEYEPRATQYKRMANIRSFNASSMGIYNESR